MTTPDTDFMRLALRLAKRGRGATSPNPMVGAVLVRHNRIIGRGWHRRAGEPHAEIEAIRDAAARNEKVAGATLYVTLEPCCTQGRTPPCTQAIEGAGITRVVAAAIDPNPAHAGKGLQVLERAGIEVASGLLESEATRLNEAFNHWITRHTPFVTIKAAVSLDGKIATASGESKWITGARARAFGMKLRQEADAILVGVNTILADAPRLTRRGGPTNAKPLRRIILDSLARTPPDAQVISDAFTDSTTVVATRAAPAGRVGQLSKLVTVWTAPARDGRVDLPWLLRKLGKEGVTSLLVEGGGEVNASFFTQKLAQRVVFFYAPKIMGGRDAIKAVGGAGFQNLNEAIRLREVQWRRLGRDILLTARSD